MSRMRDFLVGLLTVGAIAVLVVVTMYMRHWDLLSQRSTYYVLFKSVRRLEIGAPVLIHGVQVGEVVEMSIMPGDYPVRVEIHVDKNQKLYSNARVRIVPANVIGETTINIDAGEPAEHAHLLKPDGTLIGTPTPEITEIVGEVSRDMQDVMKGLAVYLDDPENQKNAKRLIRNAADATGQIDQTFTQINQQLVPLIKELTGAARRLNLALQTSEALADKIGRQVERTADSAVATAGHLHRRLQRLAIRYERLADELTTTVATGRGRLNATLSQLNEASRNLNRLTASVRAGEGTLGRLLTDPSLFDQLQQLVATISKKLTGRQEPTFSLSSPPPTTPSPEITPR